jgi:hypothetical protein
MQRHAKSRLTTKPKLISILICPKEPTLLNCANLGADKGDSDQTY